MLTSIAFFRLKCDEAPEEPPTVTIERVLKIECNIVVSTNYMHTGIMDVSFSPGSDSRLTALSLIHDHSL